MINIVMLHGKHGIIKENQQNKNTKGTVLERKTVPFARPNSAFCRTKVCILQTADNEAVAKQKMFCRMVTPQNGSPMAKCRACASRKWRML